MVQLIQNPPLCRRGIISDRVNILYTDSFATQEAGVQYKDTSAGIPIIKIRRSTVSSF